MFKLVAVIGAGVMGSDIAFDVARFNYSVIVKDISETQLVKAKEKIQINYKLAKLIQKDSIKVSLDELFSKIEFVTEYNGFEPVDLIIENITEDFDTKKILYNELTDVCHKEVIYGVNTSCIPIEKIANLTPKPENVIGIHFMNPAPLKELVEVIQSRYTSKETLIKVKEFLNSLRKKCVVVKDAAGFVTNRVLMVMINESIRVVQEGIANSKDVDKIFKLGFAHKTGPLATADLIGLDTILCSLNVLYQSYQDSKYRPCQLLKEMVASNKLGQKTGQGFFKYNVKRDGKA